MKLRLSSWIGILLGLVCVANTSSVCAGHVTTHTTYIYFTQRSPGSNCVSETATIGDAVKLPNGTMATVEALYGKSSACTDPNFPINAKLGNSKTCSVAIPFNVNAGIFLPDGWTQVKQNCGIASKGFFFFAANKALNAGLLISDKPRSEFPDMKIFAKNKRDEQIANLDSPQASDIEELLVNGRPAWRFQVTGTMRTNKKDFTYLITIIDSGKEIVMVLASIIKESFAENQEDLNQLAFDVKGLMD